MYEHKNQKTTPILWYVKKSAIFPLMELQIRKKKKKNF